MKARRILLLQAFALGLACTWMAPSAWAQKPAQPPSAKAPGKPAPAPKPVPKAAPKPSAKPAAGTKEPSKSPEASAGKPAKPEPARPSTSSASHQVVERESRIEFDERMVRGQSAAGAIYLFQRSPSEFKSIVQVPDSFRPRTVELLTPRRGPS